MNFKETQIKNLQNILTSSLRHVEQDISDVKKFRSYYMKGSYYYSHYDSIVKRLNRTRLYLKRMLLLANTL